MVNKVVEVAKEVVETVVDAAKEAFDAVLDAYHTGVRLANMMKDCANDINLVVTKVKQMSDIMKKLFEAATCPCGGDMTDVIFTAISSLLDNIRTSIDATACCLDRIMSFGDRADHWIEAFTLTVSASISGNVYRMGLAYEFTGENRKLAFLGGCAGMKPGSEEVDVNIGFWTRFDDIPEESKGATIAANAPPLLPPMFPLPPVAELAAGLIARGTTLIGVAFSIGKMNGMPFALNYFTCENKLKKIWQTDNTGKQIGIVPSMINMVKSVAKGEASGITETLTDEMTNVIAEVTDVNATTTKEKIKATKEKIKDVTKLVKSFSDVGCGLTGKL